MNRAAAQAFMNAVISMRRSAADEQALSASAVYPLWRGGMALDAGDRVRHGGVLYRALQTHEAQEAWTPDAAPSLFARVLIPDRNVIPEWVQPDSTNPYSMGDRVLHNGSVWVSDIDGNVWEPGVYGWTAERSADA